jgi:MFS superfamily sulfate permease-like transporter
MNKTINPKETARAKKAVRNGNSFEQDSKEKYGLVDHRGNSPDFVRNVDGKTYFVEAKFHGDKQQRALITLRQLKRVNNYNNQKTLDNFSKKKSEESAESHYLIRLNGKVYWVPSEKLVNAMEKSQESGDRKVVKDSHWGMNAKSRDKVEYYQKAIEADEKENREKGETQGRNARIADCKRAIDHIVSKENRPYIRLTQEEIEKMAVRVDAEEHKKKEAKQTKITPSVRTLD